jgi:hypothetical protein
MAALVQSMLLKCLDAFVKGDEALARSVLLADDEVDRLRDAVYAALLNTMQRDPCVVPAAVDLIFVARNLERIGDHATNIAEDVVFLIKGVDVRHAEESERSDALAAGCAQAPSLSVASSQNPSVTGPPVGLSQPAKMSGTSLQTVSGFRRKGKACECGGTAVQLPLYFGALIPVAAVSITANSTG